MAWDNGLAVLASSQNNEQCLSAGQVGDLGSMRTPYHASCALHHLPDCCAGGLGQWPSMSDSPGIGPAGGMASLHSKLDQLIAAYTLASTPRGTFIPESIFAPAPNTRTEAVAQDLLATAESIAPKGRRSTLSTSSSVNPAGDAAQGRAGAVSALSPALSRGLPGSALRPASLVIPGGAPSAAQTAPAKVRFSVTASDSSAAENVGMASRPAAGQAVSKGTVTAAAASEDTALQAGDAGLQPAPASSSQATAVSASAQGPASATSEAAAAAAILASQQGAPLPGASVKPRRSIKQFLQRALH